MADYVAVADNIIGSFTFGHPFDPTFHTPVTPLLIAISKLISVAICRPSIFWSLKISTESVCEALLYVTSALTLATLRTQRLSVALAAGACCLLPGLNRPNYLPGILLVFLAIVVRARTVQLSDAKRSKSWRSLRIFDLTLGLRQMALPAVFLLGFLGSWAQWIARNYVNYGEFTPTSSSEYLAIVWEQGAGPIRTGRYDSLKLADGSEFSKFGIDNVLETWRKRPTQSNDRDSPECSPRHGWRQTGRIYRA